MITVVYALDITIVLFCNSG